MALEILNDKIHIQRTYKNFQLNISIDQFPLSGLIVFFWCLRKWEKCYFKRNIFKLPR